MTQMQMSIMCVVGDPKQFSCYSTLRLPRNSAMDAALHQHCTIPAGLIKVDTPASADLKCEPVNNEDLFKAKHTVDACQGLTSKIALLPTGRPSGIGCSSNLRRHMVRLSRLSCRGHEQSCELRISSAHTLLVDSTA